MRTPKGLHARVFNDCSGKARIWLVVIVLIVGLIVAGWVLIFVVGPNFIAGEVKLGVQDNPVVLEHLGKIESIRLEFWNSRPAGAAEGAMGTYVLNLKGTKGEGVLKAELMPIDDEYRYEFISGTLQLASGETLELLAPDPTQKSGPALSESAQEAQQK